MPAKFVITKARGGKFRFELLASNGKVLAQSMAHDTKRAAVSALRSVQKNASTDVVDDQSEPAKKATTAKTAATKSAARKTAATKTAAKTAAAKTATSRPAAKRTAAKTAAKTGASTGAAGTSETGQPAPARSAGRKRVAATATRRR